MKCMPVWIRLLSSVTSRWIRNLSIWPLNDIELRRDRGQIREESILSSLNHALNPNLRFLDLYHIAVQCHVKVKLRKSTLKIWKKRCFEVWSLSIQIRRSFCPTINPEVISALNWEQFTNQNLKKNVFGLAESAFLICFILYYKIILKFSRGQNKRIYAINTIVG